MPDSKPRDQRVGYAFVALGRSSVGHILPAFARSTSVTSLVSGDRGKASTLARDYGVSGDAVFSYAHSERVQHRKNVDVVYIMLPNSVHVEFTLCAAKIGKHVLCEKQMATSVADCPHDRCVRAFTRAPDDHLPQRVRTLQQGARRDGRKGRLGTPLQGVTSNSRDMGDPSH